MIGKSLSSFFKWGSVGIIRLIIKHWYLFVLLVIIIPPTFSSVSRAIDERNPSIPIIEIGLIIINADASISKDVDLLMTNPAELIGMEKPENGIYKTFKYYWLFWWNVIFKLIGSVWLITFPFIVFYKYFRWRGSKGFKSSPSYDTASAIIWGLLTIFVVNLIIVIHGLVRGTALLTIPDNMTFFEETWFIIRNTLPFHGIAKLLHYLLVFLRS